jgi:hypothetical protein
MFIDIQIKEQINIQIKAKICFCKIFSRKNNELKLSEL